MGPVKLFASAVHLVVSGALWFLSVTETYLHKIGGYPQVYDSNKESLYLSTQPKRKKLLVDIKYLPDNQFEFVSVTTTNPDEAKLWLPKRILKKVTVYVLKSIHFGRKMLSKLDPLESSPSSLSTIETQHYEKKGSWFSFGWILQKPAYFALNMIHIGRNVLTALDSKISSYLELPGQHQVSNGPDTGSRKMISPRKRLPQMKRHLVKRCIMKLFYVEPDGFTFDPVEDSGEDEAKHKVHQNESVQEKVSKNDDEDGQQDKEVGVNNLEGNETQDILNNDDTTDSEKSFNDKDTENDSGVRDNNVDVNATNDLNEEDVNNSLDQISTDDDENSQEENDAEDRVHKSGFNEVD